MACLTFPNTGLVPGVTTYVADNVTYLWDGTVWEAITAPLAARQITFDSTGNVKDKIDENTSVNKAQLIAQGLSGDYGFFADGFTYVNEGDVGITADNAIWIYVGAGAPNKVIAAGTVPSVSAGYEQVVFNAASGVVDSRGTNVQDYIDGNLTPFKTVADMKAATYLSTLPEFTRVEWQGYYTQSDGGSNWGVLRFGAHTEDGGSIFSIDANTYIEATMTKGVEAQEFGADGGASMDASSSIQAACDFTEKNEEVIVNGSFKLDNDVLLKTGGVRGSSTGHDTRPTFKIYDASIRQGYSTDDVTNRRDHPYGGWYSDIDRVSIDGFGANTPLVVNNESHFTDYTDSSFRNASATEGVPLMRLGATLYTRVKGCDFGGGVCDGIHSRETDFNVAYYGTNASWFSENNFNLKGTAAHIHGIYSFRDSTIESGSGIGKPKLIIGEVGGSVSSKVVVDNVYFECSTDRDYITAPLVELQSTTGLTLTNSIMANQAGRNTSSINPTCVKTADGVSVGGAISINYNSFRPVPNESGVASNLGRAVDINTNSANYYLELVGNDWGSGGANPADEMFVINGKSVFEMASTQSVYTTGRMYVRDEEHGEVRQNMPSRDIWCDHYREVDANNWKLSGGRNLVLTYAPTSDVTVFEPEKWKGASFKMHFFKSCTLKHGAGFFQLSKGVDVTIPSGLVIEFVVDFQGKVREVGTSTMSL